MLIVHAGNRIEELVGVLAEQVSRPCEPAEDAPLRPETIAVQGRGMERWLAMELARRLSVWANPSFPFPRRLLEQAFDAVLGPLPDAGRPFEPASLTWSIASLLPGLLEQGGFAPLRRFLHDDAAGERRIQLAARVAETLDRYVIHRPERIAAWEQGADAGADAGDARWQATLWRELVARHGRHHLGARAEAFRQAVAAGGGPLPGFPPRVFLFGITTLPPLYVDVLVELSRRVELHLFVLRCARDPLEENGPANPLWTSLGTVGRQFHEVLAARGLGPSQQRAVDRDPGRATRLAALQQAVLLGAAMEPGAQPATADTSVQVHACRGPLREIEVLHDRLTDLFESDPSLEPRDVVVMTPDIERYAPFVEAVFGASGESSSQERPRIGFRLADRRIRATYDVVDAFSRILDALSGRLAASTVVDLLLAPRIRRRFGIETADLDLLLAWIRDAGIRWGADAHHRAETGQSALAQNTWREGLDRLLLGLAMPGEDRLFAGTAPAPDVEPARAGLLGAFVTFCERLMTLRESTAGPRPLAVWSADLADLLDAMIDPADDGARQRAWLRSALDELAERAREAGFDEPVSLASVRGQLDALLARADSSHGFLSGGVTFCELVPMRSIPFRVVALVGMNDDAFPRSRAPSGFDLVASDPRPGDRTARDDDRHLFLEAVISARQHLVVTYAGRSLRDGSLRAPSVVVAELLEELGRQGETADPEASRGPLVREHPLHGFSPRYFDPAAAGDLFSYSASECESARTLLTPRPRAGRPFVTTPLPEGVSPGETIELLDVLRFFDHPVRFFLQRPLGLYLSDEAEPLEDREPLELDALDQWKLGDALLQRQLAGGDEGEIRELLRAQGVLPPGALGEVVWGSVAASVRRLIEKSRAICGGAPRGPLRFDRPLGPFRLVGEIGALWPGGRVMVQYSRSGLKHELGLWIQHLVLCWLAPPGIEHRSVLVARDAAGGADVVRLEPHAAPEPLLRDLLELYALGQRVPLPALRDATEAQARYGAKHGWPDEVASRARSAWVPGGSFTGAGKDRSEAYLAQAFRDVEPLDPDTALPGGETFVSLTRRIYAPYLSERRQDGGTGGEHDEPRVPGP